jgi:NtrC-family two-component system response regulator AlgB
LSGDLMTSALFGHRKGAFTGAVADVSGKVQEAEGGTLFLDEIGELTADAQARLLRFLNDRTYERLGEARERRADVRIIAATNRHLEGEVQAGRFREDLFYRVNVVTLVLPPLRERPEDIVPLARHYLVAFSRKQRRPGLFFSETTEHAFQAHQWPGNLRELRNGVERAVILAPRECLEPGDLGLADTDSATPRAYSPTTSTLGAPRLLWLPSNVSISPMLLRVRPPSMWQRARWASTPRPCSANASDSVWRE